MLPKLQQQGGACAFQKNGDWGVLSQAERGPQKY